MSGDRGVLVDICAAHPELLHRQPRRLPDQQEARHPRPLSGGPTQSVRDQVWIYKGGFDNINAEEFQAENSQQFSKSHGGSES